MSTGPTWVAVSFSRESPEHAAVVSMFDATAAEWLFENVVTDAITTLVAMQDPETS